MHCTNLFLLSCLIVANCTSVLSQDTLPAYEEHHLEKTGEPCIEYEDDQERCTTLDLSWVTFDNLPVLNDSITASVKGMLVDDEQPNTTGTLDEMADAWFSRLRDEAAQDTLTPPDAWVWNYQQSISMHDRHGDLLTVQEESYTDTGGAHGLPYTGYLHWSISNDKEVVLDDLLVDRQEEAFWSLAREAHRRWAEENELNQDFLDGWPFDSTDVFYFGEEGLALVYNVYHIAPYVMGLQELVIPWEELVGVVKPDYLSLLR